MQIQSLCSCLTGIKDWISHCLKFSQGIMCYHNKQNVKTQFSLNRAEMVFPIATTFDNPRRTIIRAAKNQIRKCL